MYLKSQNSFLAALYMRLSKDDGDKVESDSIRNQRSLLRDFVKQHSDITLVKEYVDDGFSGTNFERPDFQRMLEDARNHKINCIIVKDLSRLGRNYIETGRYLEKIFPVLGIRFIAVNDHYDSADTTNDSDQIIVPFKNLVNDAYCRDISIKIRSQLDIKRKKGQFIGNYAGYGYFKDPKDKNHLVIDEYAAEIVRMIFNMKIDGYSAKNIAARLNEMGVLIPAEYKRACGFNYSSGFMAGKKPKWDVSSVLRILKNELYTGTMVQGKTRKINYKVNVRQKIEPENWIRVEGTHEPIVSKEIFECVQKLMELDTRTSPEEESIYEFSGLLRCGDCGQNLVRRTTTKKGKKYFYYHCSTYKRKEGCSSHNISNITEVCGIKVIGHIEDLPKLFDGFKKLVVTIGNNSFREHVYTEAKHIGFTFPNIICDSAYISPYAKIGNGCVILNNVCIQNGTTVGNGVLLSPGVELHHDTIIEDCVLIYANSVIRAMVHVGKKVKIGSTCTISNSNFPHQ